MCECYIRRKNKKKKGKFLVVFIVVTATICIYLFTTLNINPVLKTISEEKVRALTTLSINTAAQNTIGEAFDYADIIQITRDSLGDISLIQVNSGLANTLARKTVIESQMLISSLGEQGIKVPLGSLSGMTVFAGKGPEVNIKVYPVGAVSSRFQSQFVASGINQTHHTLKILVTSKVNVVIPGASRTVTTETEIMLCESIIVGKIPEVYLQSTSVSDMMDLIP